MKKLSLLIVQIILIASIGYSQSITIGKQVWMTKNLDVDKFQNGDPIPQAKTEEEWKNALKNKQPAWCYYDNNNSISSKYGKLYNWFAVNDPRGLAPKGWHVPTALEWTELVTYLGNQSIAGKKMKSKDGWPNNCNGTNESGFTGYPGGYRDNKGIFIGSGKRAQWWSSTKGFEAAHSIDIDFFNAITRNIGTDWGNGLSVRCLKN